MKYLLTKEIVVALSVNWKLLSPLIQKVPYYQILGAYKIIERVDGAHSGLLRKVK